MDSPILIILIIAALSIRSILKSKERLHRKAEEAGEKTPTPWETLMQPDEDELEGPGQGPAPRPAMPRQAAPRPEVSQPPIARLLRPVEKPEVQAPVQSRYQASAKPAEGGRLLHAKPSAETEPEEGENSSADEAFDLRQAVIYSEILKPKFDEN